VNKLWILRPANEDAAPWMPWFDRMFGFVIRAKSESAARMLAAEQAGDEGPQAWLSPDSAPCTELRVDGHEEVIMRDYNTESRAGPRLPGRPRVDKPHELRVRH
jgi:hypothetical protein